MPDADQINALLPQTQCMRCGYPDCAAYARAIAAGEYVHTHNVESNYLPTYTLPK